MIVDDPNGTPTSKKITLKTLYGNINSNTVFRGVKNTFNSNSIFNKFLTANNVILTKGSAPATNNATTESMSVGQIRFTNTHLYIATDSTTIKRVALSVFT